MSLFGNNKKEVANITSLPAETRAQRKKRVAQQAEAIVDRYLKGELSLPYKGLPRNLQRSLKEALVAKAIERAPGKGNLQETLIREAIKETATNVLAKVASPVTKTKEAYNSAKTKVTKRKMNSAEIAENAKACADELRHMPKAFAARVKSGRCGQCSRRLMNTDEGVFCERRACNKSNLRKMFTEINGEYVSIDDIKAARAKGQKAVQQGIAYHPVCGSCNMNGIFHNCAQLYGERLR